MDQEKMTLPITTKWKATITNMNKDQKLIAEAYNKVLGENARRSAAGLDMDGLMADQERYEKELDKKEAYKASLAGHNSDDEASSHLERVYQAVKDGEWSFEDFKDFVSVVRNEAKIRD